MIAWYTGLGFGCAGLIIGWVLSAVFGVGARADRQAELNASPDCPHCQQLEGEKAALRIIAQELRAQLVQVQAMAILPVGGDE
jgi:hypothetical protein